MRGSRRRGGGGAGPEGEAEGRGMRSPRRPAEKARAAVSSGEERGGLGSPRQALLSRVPSAGSPSADSPRRAPLSQVSSARSPQRAHLSGRKRRAATGPRAGGGGGSPWPGGRGHGRGCGGPGGPRRGASGRAGALVPSRLPVDRGAAGTQRPDLSPGRVRGRRAMPRAPASASSPGLPRPRPSGRRRLLHRPRDQRHPSPPPAPPGPGPPRPRLPRAGRGPARAAGAGRMHGRRKEAAAARPSGLQVPGGVETRSPGPGGCVRPGRRGGLAGGSGSAPERPLTKARRRPPRGPPSARLRAPRAARPRPPTSPSPESRQKAARKGLEGRPALPARGDLLDPPGPLSATRAAVLHC